MVHDGGIVWEGPLAPLEVVDDGLGSSVKRFAGWMDSKLKRGKKGNRVANTQSEEQPAVSDLGY